ncbi:BrnT family toxin [Thiotrichales bacterium HSG1]|nr:BrnT family toxin [Thiotrichales bacterium HSG1]
MTKMQYNFEWDAKKAKTNIHKHKINFERAATIFRDSNALSIVDEEHSEYEERWVTIGLDNNGVLLSIVHTFNNINKSLCKIRVISARKATNFECKQYEG